MKWLLVQLVVTVNKFEVLRTENREGADGDYIVCVNESVKKILKLGNLAVVVYRPPKLNVELKAHCRVVIDNKLSNEQVRLDQSVRNAIGIPYGKEGEEGVKVELHPLCLSVGQRLHYHLSRLFGWRYLFFRVCKSDTPDLEKDLCRIPSDAFRLLGCEAGDTVICEAPVFENGRYKLRTYKIKAYEAVREFIEERERKEEEETKKAEKSLDARYHSAKELLEVEPDIPRIFFDWHTREALGLLEGDLKKLGGELHPVKARREITNLFFKELVGFGIMVLLSLLSALSIFAGYRPSLVKAIAILVTLTAFSFLIMTMKIRSEVTKISFKTLLIFLMSVVLLSVLCVSVIFYL